MYGDKKSKTIDKGEEVFYRFSLRPAFNHDLVELRKKYKIPSGGFTDQNYIETWLRKFDKAFDRVEYYLDTAKFLSKHKLPLTRASSDLLDEHLLSNNKIKFRPSSLDFCCIVEPPGKEETDNFSISPQFVRIRIYPDASISDVVAYVKKNWWSIRKLLGSRKRIRKTLYKEVYAEIFELSQKSREELGLRRGDYRDVKISQMIKEKYGLNFSPEYIRKIISTQRKLRN